MPKIEINTFILWVLCFNSLIYNKVINITQILTTYVNPLYFTTEIRLYEKTGIKKYRQNTFKIKNIDILRKQKEGVYKMEDRKQKLIDIFKNVEESKQELVSNLIEEVIFLEEQLRALKKLPFIKVHPEFSDIQKGTAAQKQYKEFMQSYINAVKVLSSTLSRDLEEEDDEFDEFIKNRGK